MTPPEGEQYTIDKMIVALTNRITSLREEVNELTKQQTRLMQLIRRTHASAEERKKLSERIRRLEKVAFPQGVPGGDEPGTG